MKDLANCADRDCSDLSKFLREIHHERCCVGNDVVQIKLVYYFYTGKHYFMQPDILSCARSEKENLMKVINAGLKIIRPSSFIHSHYQIIHASRHHDRDL